MDCTRPHGHDRPARAAHAGPCGRALGGVPRSADVDLALDPPAVDTRGARRLAPRRARRRCGRLRAAARHDERRAGRGLDPLPRPTSRARIGGDRLDVAPSVRLGHRGERRGEAPDARARVRDLGLPPRGVEDRRAERAVARRDGGVRRYLRGSPPEAHARPGRREPGLRVVQRHGRRLARRSRRPAGAARRPRRLTGREAPRILAR